MTKRRAEIAQTLLDLLVDHVGLCGTWQAHNMRATRKKFHRDEEEKNYRAIIRTFTIPLMDRCKVEGFDYSQLSDIIPGAFVTTVAEREKLLSDLTSWAWDEFDLGQLVPF